MISVTILIKNGERRLEEVLEALRRFNEVILYDTGSTDRTLAIAEKFPNVTIYCEAFNGFGPAHNAAAARAKNPWILSIDADEVLSAELVKEILETSLRPGTVYALPFHNYFNGKLIKCCGWYPESHVRLYNKTETAFSDAMVHEGVIKNGFREVAFQNPILHYSYDSITDFLTKMERYSSLFAQQYRNKRKSSPLIAFNHGAAAFLKSFILKRGFLGGFEGFLISAYNGHTAFYKYLKLYQENRRPCY
ncbi:MAG: glycosyltransferase family 2 protein [Chlamydiales bacterium]|nr:glycosyltransferase family 2 protein [Chlamydiales bacterium]